MQSPVQLLRRQDVDLPEIDVTDLHLPKVDLSKIELPRIDVPNVDLAKTATEAAVAVGLMKPRRPRWQFALGAVVVAVAATVIVANADAIRTRLGKVRDQVTERARAMRSSGMETEPVAFTAAETKPIEEPAMDPTPRSTSADYPDGLGAGTTPVATNGRSKVTTDAR